MYDMVITVLSVSFAAALAFHHSTLRQLSGATLVANPEDANLIVTDYPNPCMDPDRRKPAEAEFVDLVTRFGGREPGATACVGAEWVFACADRKRVFAGDMGFGYDRRFR